MADFLKWLITSSADPKKVSLAVRGFLIGLVPIAMMFFGLTDVEANAFVNVAEDLVFYSFSIVAVVQMAYGLYRKIARGRWAHEEY